jgi:hypothetical protein
VAVALGHMTRIQSCLQCGAQVRSIPACNPQRVIHMSCGTVATLGDSKHRVPTAASLTLTLCRAL